jgi:hypothetical protein
MTGIDVLLLSLVQIAETPLYSAYAWLGKQLGRDLSLTEFLAVIDRLNSEEILRLWKIDPTTGARVDLAKIPSGLEIRYRTYPNLDPSFDPFSLSLTPGLKAPKRPRPEWEVDLDFEKRVFRVRARAGMDASALRELSALFPGTEFYEERRRVLSDGCVQLTGSLSG